MEGENSTFPHQLTVVVKEEQLPDDEIRCGITVKEEPIETDTGGGEYNSNSKVNIEISAPGTSHDDDNMDDSTTEPEIPFNLPLSEYCRRVVSEYHPPSPKVRCGVCGSMLRLWERHGVQVNVTLAHALSHVKVHLFSCRYCDFGSVVQWVMPGHLKRAHRIPCPNSTHYIDSTNKYRAEIRQVIDRCFKIDAKRQTEPDEEEGAAETGVTTEPSAGCKSLWVDHHELYTVAMPFSQYCEMVINGNYTADESVRCNTCDHTWSDRSAALYLHAVHHVLDHMPAALFRCNLCSETVKTKTAIREHLKKSHQKVHPAHQWRYYTDSLKDNRKDILEMIGKCFSKRGTSSGGSSAYRPVLKKYSGGRAKNVDHQVAEQRVKKSKKSDEDLERGVYDMATAGADRELAEGGDDCGICVVDSPSAALIPVKRRVFYKCRANPGGYFICTRCEFCTSYEKMMRNHILLVHPL